MKEYWVNVYGEDNELGMQFKTIAIAKEFYKNGYKNINYRIHVREFETKEAKELYLKMKYGKLFMYNSYSLVQFLDAVYNAVMSTPLEEPK